MGALSPARSPTGLAPRCRIVGSIVFRSRCRSDVCSVLLLPAKDETDDQKAEDKSPERVDHSEVISFAGEVYNKPIKVIRMLMPHLSKGSGGFPGFHRQRLSSVGKYATDITIWNPTKPTQPVLVSIQAVQAIAETQSERRSFRVKSSLRRRCPKNNTRRMPVT